MLWVDAAGNSGASACDYSPGRASSGFTVGASSPVDDSCAPFSNIGACVDAFAPGVDSVGAWYTGVDAYVTGSGTSFSAPLVTGIAATYWAAFPSASVDDLKALVQRAATSGALKSLPSGTVNLLAYSAPNGQPELLPFVSLSTPTPTASVLIASATSSVSSAPSGASTATPSLTPSFSRTATASTTRVIATSGTATASVTRSYSTTRSSSYSRSVTGSGSQTRTPRATRSPSRTGTRTK